LLKKNNTHLINGKNSLSRNSIYKLDKNNFVMEIYSQEDYLNFGELVLKLHNPAFILDDIGSKLEEFKK
jgi:hypothetical protein